MPRPLRRINVGATYRLNQASAWLTLGSSMKSLMNRLARAALIVAAPLVLAACGINTIPTQEEQARTA